MSDTSEHTSTNTLMFGSECKLGEVATFEMGQAPPGIECNKERRGTAFVKAGEFGDLYPLEREWTTRPLKFGKKGDVFICVVGATAGKLNLGIDCAIGRSVAAIRPKDGIDTKFVYYQLQPFVFKLRAASTGSAQGVIAKTQLEEVPFRVVSLDQQQRIVSEIEKQFSRIDEAVANLKCVKVNLKRYRAAVLKAAVEGKITEEWRKAHPDVEPASKLLERILAERRAKWSGRGKYTEPDGPDTSHLSNLPEGWAWATAEQLTDETRAITYGVIKLGPHMTDGVPVLRSSDVRSLHLDLQEVKRVAPEIAGQFKRTFLRGNEILVTVRGTLGGVVVAPGQCSGFNISREVAMLALVDEEIAKAMAIFIASAPIQRWLLQRTKGIAYTGINIETLKELPLPLPSIDEQQQIIAEIDRRLSVIEELEAAVEANLTRAERLRKGILREAFTGQLLINRSDLQLSFQGKEAM